MGVWGSGTFDSDSALSFLDTLTAQLYQTINAAMSPDQITASNFFERYGEAQVIPAIDVLITLCKTYIVCPPIERAEVEAWQAKYLQIYDSVIDSYTPKTQYKVQRRQVIVDTFTSLLDLIEKWDSL